MKLTLPADYMARGMPCLRYHETLGSDVPMHNVSRSCYSTVVIPFDARVLVDACDQFKVKVLDPASTFLLLANSGELDDVGPILEVLRAHKIIAVEPVVRLNNAAIKEELRKSFYDSQGSLINSKFAQPGLSPSDMAGAGFGFSGDASDDLVKCHYNDSHVLRNWQLPGSPRNMHLSVYRCVCFNQPAYNLPFLSDASGKDITGQVYQVVDHYLNSIYCRRAVVLTRHDLPVSKATLKTLELDIDALYLNKMTLRLQKQEQAGLINELYFALRRRFLYVSHFAKLFRKFEWLREEYIALLNSYKPQLQMEPQVAVVENTIATLLACPVREEMKRVVSALVALEKEQWEGKQKPVCRYARTCYRKNWSFDLHAGKGAETLLAWLAEAHNIGYFLDASLNELITTGSLGSLISDDYFSSAKRDDALMEVLGKGAELTGVLVGIAEEIHCLIKPFLSKERSCSGEGTDLTKRHRSHTGSL